MTHYTATPKGMIPFTAEQEDEIDAREEANINADNTAFLASEIRRKRNKALLASDWMGCTDVKMTSEWRTYRQELRDITDQPDFPNDVTFPVEPDDKEGT